MEVLINMASNVINLNTKLIARKDNRALTQKQELMIDLENIRIEKMRLLRQFFFHRNATKRSLDEFYKLKEHLKIKQHELDKI